MTSALGFAVANMDPSVNPAHDFYRFAAGRWVDQTIIPDTEGPDMYDSAAVVYQQSQDFMVKFAR